MFFRKRLLSEGDFAAKFAKQLIKNNKGLKIISINELEVKSEFNEGEHQHFLNNAYSEYVNDPKFIKRIIEKYVNGLSSMFLPKELLDAEKILPVIKDRRFIKSLEDINADFEKNHIYEFYNEELIVFYVEDRENSIHYLSKDDLEEINFSIDNLRRKAIENLSNNFEMKRHGENGYFMLTVGGNYESSLILLDIWNHENFLVDGSFVIGIPSRDLLLITGSKDSENLHRLYDSVQNINETGDHIVSDKIFEFKNGKFEVLQL
ncbi:Protein of unknown function [Flavobacterium resistens]|uniref:DUF1444 family protein n=1 Tax=Flavobacterium resistens TaxID=443612 RepID=A0A521DNS5_9FLAO|nr:DUF1444 family protein [Flavobacterium resistens]MRX68302.1 DUF1444 family protein [Flavobacterium resistens]SMO73252.1 Protein of unknown function [Flavobacterium resistens]